MSTAVSVRLCVRAPDGQVTRRIRLSWAAPPTAGELLGELTTRLLDARRRGESVTVESAPAAVRTVLAVAGLLGIGQPSESGRPSSANTGAPRK